MNGLEAEKQAHARNPLHSTASPINHWSMNCPRTYASTSYAFKRCCYCSKSEYIKTCVVTLFQVVCDQNKNSPLSLT